MTEVPSLTLNGTRFEGRFLSPEDCIDFDVPAFKSPTSENEGERFDAALRMIDRAFGAVAVERLRSMPFYEAMDHVAEYLLALNKHVFAQLRNDPRYPGRLKLLS